MLVHTSAACEPNPSPQSKSSWLKWVFIPLCFIPVIVTAAGSPSAATGKAISGQCAACHGNNGRATNTSYPNLAGQNYQYLVGQLNKFKNGERQNSIMRSITLGLSTEQIQDLSAYYAGIGAANCK